MKLDIFGKTSGEKLRFKQGAMADAMLPGRDKETVESKPVIVGRGPQNKF